MIQQETLANGFVHTWTDQEGYHIKNVTTGDTFSDAIDNPEWGIEYVEEQDNEEKEANNEQVSQEV